MNLSPILPVGEILYFSRNCPPLDRAKAVFNPGICGCCHRSIDVAPKQQILTKTFGSLYLLKPSPDDGKFYLCKACAWTFRTKDYNAGITLIWKDGTVERNPGHEKMKGLLRKRFPAEAALVVAVGGRKALTGLAQWGKIITDDGSPFEWTKADAQILSAIYQLREYGFGPKLITEPSPNLAILSQRAPDEITQIYRLWKVVDRVREEPYRLHMMLAVSAPDKPEK